MKKTALVTAIFLTFTCLSGISSAQAAQKVDLKAGKKDFMSEKKPLEEKFFFIAKRLLLRQDELKLTPEQSKKIRLLIAETRIKLKDRDEDIDTVTIGLNTYIWGSPFDTDTINTLTMEKLHLQVEKQRFIVKSFKKLDEILTKEQKDAFKTSVR